MLAIITKIPNIITDLYLPFVDNNKYPTKVHNIILIVKLVICELISLVMTKISLLKVLSHLNIIKIKHIPNIANNEIVPDFLVFLKFIFHLRKYKFVALFFSKKFNTKL